MDRRIEKWYTITEYVDRDTGEIITKSRYEREYIIINKTKKTIINGKSGEIKYTYECEKNRQQKLWE